MNGKRRNFLKAIILTIVIVLLLVKILMGTTGLYFYAPLIDWLLNCVLVAGVFTFLYLQVAHSWKITVLIAGIIVECATVLLTLLFNSTDEDLELAYFKGRTQPVLIEHYYPHGLLYLIQGETYLGGLIYSRKTEEKVDATDLPYAIDLKKQYVLPASLNDSNGMVVWHRENVILDYTDFVCYPAVAK